MKTAAEISVSEELIMSKIYVIRNKKVMIDRDLAELYGVETKRLKEAVRRKMDRFPEDFMFELTKEEFSNWRSQFASSNADKMGLRVPPFAFTEHGVIMLASILNSERAIQVNIQIVRAFVNMRKMVESQHGILNVLLELKQKDIEQDEKIIVIFEYLKQLETARKNQEEFRERKRVGFMQGGKRSKN